MTVTNTSEIELNSQKYKIKGAVKGAWVDPFPDQITLGDADYANRKDLSSWMIQDMRGGIGVEEMDEKIDSNRCWWTNCIIQYRNHILPPRLATSITPTGTPICFANFNGYLYLATTTGLYRLASNRASWTSVKADFTGTISALVPSLNSKLYIFLGGTSVASDGLVDSDDPENSSTSETYAKVAELTCLGAGTFRIKFDLKRDAGAAGTAYAKIYRNGVAVGAEATNTTSTYATSSEDIGGWRGGDLIQLYIHRDVGGTTTAWQRNFRIYGTAKKYWHMDTAEAFTQSLTGGKWGIQYDAKLFKMTSDGTVKYSTDPDGTTPTWSSGGAINDIADQIQGFQIGRDASGAYELYAPTKSILKAYDSATPQWIDTEAVLPNHPIGGQGHAYWNGKLYFSYGLAVKEYYPETGSFIDVGLTERDGLPVEYNGEIVKLLGDTGVKGMFAAVDASVTAGGSQSGLDLYDGIGWQCWWIESSPHKVTDTTNTVSSADASSEATMITLFNEIKADYNAHIGSTTYHRKADTSNIITSANVAEGNSAATYCAFVNELKADYNSHRNQDGVHCGKENGNEVTTADATTVNGCYTLGNEIKTDYNAHILNALANQTMHDIIVSSASSAYAVYWDCGGIIYYIDIPRGIENPDKISQNYAITGIFLSSWYDAGNPVAAKLAKVLADYAKGITTTETVALKYRIDHTYTDLDTGWTTLDTLNTTGETGYNEELFASGAGISFKAIQFRLDFVTPGATAKSDILSLVFYHKKRTGSEKLRTWVVTVICDNYGLTTAKEKIANLKSAIESTTDVLFSYHPNDASTEQYYVTVNCESFSEQTGREYDANFELQLIES